MLTVSKSKLKAELMAYFRHVEETGETVVVTSHKKPILKIEPIKEPKALAEQFSHLQGTLVGSETDLLSPLTEEWENA